MEFKQVKESKARYKIAEEVQRDGVSHFWVYKPDWSTSMFFRKARWRPDKIFTSMEDAEKYVRESIEYEYNSKNPKQVRFY